MKDAPFPTTDIVITSFQGKHNLVRLLTSLEHQSYSNFGVIIVYDGSSADQRISPVEFSLDIHNVLDTSCSAECYCLARARNIGILASQAEYIILLDHDCTCSDNFVLSHLSGARSNTILAGPRFPNSFSADNCRQLAKAKQLLTIQGPRPISELLKADIKLVENNISFFKQDVVRAGLFSTLIEAYGFVGQEFFSRLGNLSFLFSVSPCATIVHFSEGDSKALKMKRRSARISSLLLPFVSIAPVTLLQSYIYSRPIINGVSPLGNFLIFSLSAFLSPFVLTSLLLKLSVRKLHSVLSILHSKRAA